MAEKILSKKQKRAERKKQHAQAPILDRKVDSLEKKKKILIVGEGVHTEPSYFEKFREPGVHVVAIGLGEGTRKLVHDVESHKRAEEEKLGFTFDEVWVAFDKDSFPDFGQAISEAKAKGYHVAYSNQAIEYWFILHFMDHQGAAMARDTYADTLNGLLKSIESGFQYDPDSKVVTDEFFNVLCKRIQNAYDRADKVYSFKCQNGASTEESVTTIHLLVKSILGLVSTSEKRETEKKLESMRKAGVLN